MPQLCMPKNHGEITRDESEVFVVAIKDEEFNDKEYLVNVGKFEQYTELYDF